MSELYVVDQGACLHKKQGRFVLERPDHTEVEIPWHELSRILILGNIQLSNAVIGTCLHHQIPVIFLSYMGDYKGHLWSAQHEDLAAERGQFQKHGDFDIQLQTARALVRGKLINSRQLMMRLNRKRQIESVAKAIAGIQNDINAVDEVTSLDQLRGYEGITAARYFPALAAVLINPEFSFRERNRRPPRDPVNSLLSFGYSLLFNNVMSLILVEGLNPYLGNLHRSTKKLPELVLDLMEEFRSPVVDTLVVTLINRRTFKPADFTEPNDQGGVYLTEQSRRLFIQKFGAALEQTVHHPDRQESVTYRRAIHLQAKRYKQMILNDIPYKPFLRAV